MSLVPTIVITADRRQEAEHYARRQGWERTTADQVLTMPSLFIGSLDQIAEAMHDRRDRFGVSYYVVSDAMLNAVAPLVARLAGT